MEDHEYTAKSKRQPTETSTNNLCKRQKDAVPKSAILEESFTDVVELPSLKREEGARRLQLRAFGQNIELDLRRTEDLLPTNLPVHVYGEDEDGNPTVDDWTHRTDTFQNLYTDLKTGASLMIEDVDGETKLNGLVRDDLIIEPVTDIVLDENAAEVEKREITRLRHMIYRVEKRSEPTTNDDYAELVDETEGESDEKRAVPSKIYVTVQVVVDYALWKKLARSESEVIRYLKIFYNSVNVLYSTISQPSVSVSIHGITICKAASSCRMVEDYRLGSDGVNAKTSLSAIAKYAFEQKSSTGTGYALMIVMTDYDMCSPTSSGTCDRSTSGLAYVGTVCGAYSFSKTSKTGLAEDHGAFDGTKTVAHEMGHILGMNHDGDGPSNRGAPGANTCRFSDNFIMGQTAPVTNQYIWSSCSVNQLRWMTSQSQASCLLSKPSYNQYGLVSKLPGKEISINNQCKLLYGSSSEVGCRLPACKGDTPRIRVNGMTCTNLLSSANGLKSCDSSTIKTHCCQSRMKYCKATPISCDGSNSVTAKPPVQRPTDAWKLPTTTKKAKPGVDSCGNPCSDTANIRINGKSCSSLLSSSSGKRSYCDNPTIIQHCCQTREKVCSNYHSITPSCDSSCQDVAGVTISGKHCVDFLKSGSQSYCNASVSKTHCCASQKKYCANSAFGR
ncbi:A disintegrin and metalloproteinase with thrombospondin motifs like [Watersipora subatra]|uniref:A disintegrin and metalloproteinase with thrombospondin motifs like n=1 Tax=Watersipora subatra TaxID=2589382 RepID=UPI00355AD8CD